MSKQKNKAGLVAQREILENVRTKTFWIGILSFPVILVASILIPTWFQKKVDIRTFGVEDRSGWLLSAIEKRLEMPNFEELTKLLQSKGESRQSSQHPSDKTTEGPKVSIPKDLQESTLGKFLTAFATMAKKAKDKTKASVTGEKQNLNTLIPNLLDTLESTNLSSLLEHLPITLPIPQGRAKEGIKLFLQNMRSDIAKFNDWISRLPKEDAERLQNPRKSGKYQIVAKSTEEDLKKQLKEEKIFAFFVIGKDPVQGDEGNKYFSNNLTDQGLRRWFSNVANGIVAAKRIQKLGISPEKAAWLQTPVHFAPKKIDEAGNEAEVARKDIALKWAPVAFVYLLWISVFMMAQMMLTNTIEEKSNRIIEVLLSSVSPLELMTGKIVGIAITGLMVVGSWALFFALGIYLMPTFFPQSGGIISSLGLGSILSNPAYLASFIIYFVLGFLLYASVLGGIGSVCNSLKEAQNLQQPVVLILIIPLLAMMPIASDPNGTLARVLSFIPPFTPFVMMNRAGGPPTTWEYALTTVLLLLTVWLTFRGAAKIFRIGILMTGKPPKLREMLRWLRTPVNR
jgi:ABC-2 type transport system permease protein